MKQVWEVSVEVEYDDDSETDYEAEKYRFVAANMQAAISKAEALAKKDWKARKKLKVEVVEVTRGVCLDA